MDERRRAAWAALGLGPLWVPREGVRRGIGHIEAAHAVRAEAPPQPAQPARPDPPDGLEPGRVQPDGPRAHGVQPSAAQPPAASQGGSEPAVVQSSDPGPDDPHPSIPIRNEHQPGAVQPVVRLESLRAQVAGCPKCRLARSRTQTVFGEGNPRASWMFVGEAPGAEEDARGEPFVGQSGRLLDAMLAAIGLDRARDVYIANVVKCRPPGNRNPQPDEVASCEPYLREQIALVRPALLVLMGRFAAQALLRTTESVGALRGRVHRYDAGDFQVPALVTYHPAYLLRTPADKAKAWRDLCAARAEHARLAALQAQAARPGD